MNGIEGILSGAHLLTICFYGLKYAVFRPIIFILFLYYLCGALIWIFNKLKRQRQCMVFGFTVSKLGLRSSARANSLRKFKPHLKISRVLIPKFWSDCFCFACFLHSSSAGWANGRWRTVLGTAVRTFDRPPEIEFSVSAALSRWVSHAWHSVTFCQKMVPFSTATMTESIFIKWKVESSNVACNILFFYPRSDDVTVFELINLWQDVKIS